VRWLGALFGLPVALAACNQIIGNESDYVLVEPTPMAQGGEGGAAGSGGGGGSGGSAGGDDGVRCGIGELHTSSESSPDAPDECTTFAKAFTDNCDCDLCLEDIEACRMDIQCNTIMACAVSADCRGVDECTRADKCGTVIMSTGGPNANGAQLLLRLGGCMADPDCPLLCP
jgi:hypothetical protein